MRAPIMFGFGGIYVACRASAQPPAPSCPLDAIDLGVIAAIVVILIGLVIYFIAINR